MANAASAPASAEGLTSHTQNPPDGLLKLREPFPAEQIQGLPKITCRACSESRTKECGTHRKAKCRECGNWITSAHLHLDYVGHAELTNRLLDADLLWDWQPLAIGSDGLPVFDSNGGLWIRLTVCGHTRLGYGDAQGKKGPNAVKEAIGDALRNAAMRFGAALDLWAKSSLREALAEHPKDEAEDARAAAAERLGTLRGRMQSAWDDLVRLRQVRVTAEQWQLLEMEMPGPGGVATPVGVLLDERVRELSQAHRDGGQAPDPAGPSAAGGEAAPGGRLDELMAQVQRSWNNPLALGQVKEAARRDGLLEEKAQDPDGAWMTLQELVDGRMAALAGREGSQ